MPVVTVILDACCTLNLAATGQMAEIPGRLPYRFCIGRRAHGEAQWLRKPGEEERERVDLEPLLELNLLVMEELRDPAEEALFVQFSEQVADGEAEAAAMAIGRGYILATDDRKARRVVTGGGHLVQLTSTLELMREWQGTAGVQDEDRASVLRRIAERARYRPRRTHPLWDWWSRFVAE